jgi:hypothetical protein
VRRAVALLGAATLALVAGWRLFAHSEHESPSPAPDAALVIDADAPAPDSSASWFHARVAPPAEKRAATHREPMAVLDPSVLAAAEAAGLSLGAVLGAPDPPGQERTTQGLSMGAPAYRDVVAVLGQDLAELGARKKIGEGPDFGNHAFRARWLRSPSTRFELVGAIHRLDRRTGEPARGCGELRLVYRLAADPAGRPTTRLPMTLNVLFPQAGCRVPAGFSSLGGPELAALFRTQRFDQLEVNLQNLHGPSLREDMDDHAEYVLRAFDADERGARPRKLFNTPRTDLDAQGRARLAAFARDEFARIDDGTWVVPEELLAERVVSVTPRGAERAANRPFSELLGDATSAELLAKLPYDRAALVRSPRALLRRLDEGTCAGCHQTRAIAGFHLLGEERAATPFNALATAGSPHFHEDLRWRASVLAATSAGKPMPHRPFSSRSLDAGGYGTTCGLGDAGFASWTCRPGLTCQPTAAATPDVGLCLPPPPDRAPGDPCQRAEVIPRPGPDGDRVKPSPVESCTPPGASEDAGGEAQCSPNGFGFPGGLCSNACETLGDEKGDSICVDIPSSGYESECFFVPIPIEKCLETHKARRRVRSCDETHPCRPDFACVAVLGSGGSAPARGACVPPYFVFQARIDGPMLDRP